MDHPKTVEFDDRMKRMFDKIDHLIEKRFGSIYDLHPRRPQRGETANPQADGLFSVGVDFSPGFGSRHGRGYVVDLRISTLERVPATERQSLIDCVAAEVRRLLPLHFPERSLQLVVEGNAFKIVGDFNLGAI